MIYYFGDFDPSGCCIEETSRRKLQEFGAIFDWQRVGLLQEDLASLELVPIPVKRTDTRAISFVSQFGEHGAELDALHPDELRRRISEVIGRHIDVPSWKRLLRTQKAERESIKVVAGNWQKALAAARRAA